MAIIFVSHRPDMVEEANRVFMFYRMVKQSFYPKIKNSRR